MLFEELLDLWLDEKKMYIKSSTYAYYNFETQNYIVPVLGTINVEDIREEHIQEAVVCWQSRGMENGKPLKKQLCKILSY